MPRSGVITMPGSVKNVIRSPTCPLEMPNSCTMVGKAGVTLEVPRTHQSYAPQYVEVVVLIDPANALVSLSLRSHDRKIYQVVCSEVGSGAHSKHATPFGLRLSARRLAGALSARFGPCRPSLSAFQLSPFRPRSAAHEKLSLPHSGLRSP